MHTSGHGPTNEENMEKVIKKDNITILIDKEADNTTFVMNEKTAGELMTLLFGYYSREYVRNTLEKKDFEFTEEDINDIANRLYEELHNENALYDEAEEHDILYLAEEIFELKRKGE